VEMVAESPLTGQRRRCGSGVFNMVAIGDGLDAGGGLPPLAPEAPVADDGALRMVELVFPERTGPGGSLDGGFALGAMAKAAFVAATRHCRKSVVMAATLRVDFEDRIGQGEVMEMVPRVTAAGRSSLTVEVALWAEDLRSGARRRCGEGSFVMVAVDAGHRPAAVRPGAA
jgi:acyl-CoA hydrolase